MNLLAFWKQIQPHMFCHWVHRVEDFIYMEDLSSLLNGIQNKFLKIWLYWTLFTSSPDFKQLLATWTPHQVIHPSLSASLLSIYFLFFFTFCFLISFYLPSLAPTTLCYTPSLPPDHSYLHSSNQKAPVPPA